MLAQQTRFSAHWLRLILEWFVRPHPRLASPEAKQQSRLLSTLLLVLITSGAALIIAVVNLDPNDLYSPEVQGSILILGIATAMYVINRLGFTRMAALGVIATFTGVFGYASFFDPTGEPNPQVLVFLFVPMLLAGLFFPLRWVIALSGTILTLSIVLITAEGATVEARSGNVAFWAHRVLWYFMVFASLLLITFIQHLNTLEKIRRAELETANQRLRESEQSLERRVQERTRDLKVASNVSREITTVLDLHTLLPILVKLTQEAFSLYHTGLYLFNEEQAVLTLAAHQGGSGSPAAGEPYAIPLEHPQNLVAQVARQQQPVVANRLQEASNYLPLSWLPETSSEIALPMHIGSKLIGVLDLRSEHENLFRAEDVDILTTLAEQMAIAVRNAQLYDEAHQARTEAEEANQTKSRFLANMSHELRTPLNAILNFTEFVADGVFGDVNDQQETALRQTIASSEHLLTLINDVLDITKIEAGMMELFIEEVDLNAELASVVSVGKGLVKEKPIQFETDITALPVTYGDRRRLRQVFLNIVSNAVKFTKTGTVLMRAHFDKNANEIAVTVKDTGIGVAPEDYDKVFESFKQAKHDLVGAIGTGLGMPISKHFVGMHGGHIAFESTVNVGTIFTVRLPVLTYAQAEQRSQFDRSIVAEEADLR